MKSKIILCLALVLSEVLVDCSTRKTPVVATKGLDAEQVKLPIKFAGYREFYTFVAQGAYGGDGMPINAENLFKLASESTTKIVWLDCKQLPYVYIVEPHFFHGMYDEIRGAQGNGEYYILRPLATGDTALGGFELVGIAEGNVYTLQHSNGVPQIVAYWHISAGEHPESIYEWNGKVFEQIK